MWHPVILYFRLIIILSTFTVHWPELATHTDLVIEKAGKCNSCVPRKKNELELGKHITLSVAKNAILRFPEEPRDLKTEICHILW